MTSPEAPATRNTGPRPGSPVWTPRTPAAVSTSRSAARAYGSASASASSVTSCPRRTAGPRPVSDWGRGQTAGVVPAAVAAPAFVDAGGDAGVRVAAELPAAEEPVLEGPAAGDPAVVAGAVVEEVVGDEAGASAGGGTGAACTAPGAAPPRSPPMTAAATAVAVRFLRPRCTGTPFGPVDRPWGGPVGRAAGRSAVR
ncbi:hypothetical protein SNARM312S_05948 [Streptomyces narbonensis]